MDAELSYNVIMPVNVMVCRLLMVIFLFLMAEVFAGILNQCIRVNWWCLELSPSWLTGFELVKQNRFAKIYGHSVEKGLAQAKNVLGL